MRAAGLIVLTGALALAGCGEPAAPPTATEMAPAAVDTAPPAPPAAPQPELEQKAKDEPRPPTEKAIMRGPAKQQRIALTFDADMTPTTFDEVRAGGGPQYEQGIIRVLRHEKVPATIFVTGLWAKAYPEAVEEFARDPLFELGNHTYDHRAWTTDCYGLPAVTDPREKQDELEMTVRQVQRAGGEPPSWFRFPGLCHSAEDVKRVARAGEQVVDGISSGDAFATSAVAVEQMVLDQVEPGSIVVMHLNGAPNAPVTLEALTSLIPGLRDRGYRFVSLSDLLG